MTATPMATPPAQPEAEWNPFLPDPALQQVEAPPGFTVQTIDRMGLRRQFYDVIVAKASFDLCAEGLKRTSRPAQLAWSDAYWDDDNADLSSLKATADLELCKPSTDVLLTGAVKSLEGKPRKAWFGTLRVVRGKDEVLLQKTLRFTGPRWWKHGLLTGWTLGDPEPATAVPLRYELAYGGFWLDPKQKDPELIRQVYDPNPSGSGWFGKSHDTGKDYPGPQIEVPDKLISAANRDYAPGGFGPIARFWQPRVKWAGTHDAAWFKQFHDSVAGNQLPDYARDFDYRHFQAAPPDQVTPAPLRGDEWIELTGMFDDARVLDIKLPGIALQASLQTKDGRALRGPLQLDTVHIDLDARQVHLTWRMTLDQAEGVTHAVLTVAEPSALTKKEKK